MMLVDFLLLGILVGWLGGGSLTRLSEAQIPAFWFIILGFLIRFLSFWIPFSWSRWVGITGMFLVFVASLSGFRVRGFKLISLGAFLNCLVMLFNQGRMPVWTDMALRLELFSLVERLQQGAFAEYVALNDSGKLFFLGDVLPYFSLLFRKFFVVSIGDYLLGLGVLVFVVHFMKHGGAVLAGEEEKTVR